MSSATVAGGVKIALIIPLVLLSTGCHAPANPRTLPSSVVEQHQEELDATLRESAIAEKEGIKYRVGPGRFVVNHTLSSS